MAHNAYILDWTMDRFAELVGELAAQRFDWVTEGDGPHIRVAVPFSRVGAFAALCRKYLGSAYNYVDVQYSEERITVLVFREQVFYIRTREENAEARRCAIAQGLPAEQADWGLSV